MERVKEPFEVVYEKYFSDIYNFVYAQLLHREKTEDLVSDTFIKAMTHYDSYDPSKASVRTWLTNIARNTVIDEFRRNRIRLHTSLDDEENFVEPSAEDEYGIFAEENEREVYQLLSMLSPEERELAGMLYFQKMKNSEIGEMLGINAKAVSERHRRLLVKLRKLADKSGITYL